MENAAKQKANLPGFLGRQLDERSPAEEEAEDVRHAVVADDHGGGQNHPDHAAVQVLHHEVRLHHNQQQRKMRPAKLQEKKEIRKKR